MPADNPPPAGPWRPKFTLPTMFAVTSVMCVGAALAGGLIRSGGDSFSKATYVILVCATPVGLMLCMFAWQWFKEVKEKGIDED